MVPEGVLKPVPGGFIIYIQNNFSDEKAERLRQRFTIAHELVHTLFYDVNRAIPERKKRSPVGQELERLCNYGAGQILVPDRLLKQEVEAQGEVGSVRRVLEIARIFDVSAEVAIRQVDTVPKVLVHNFAAILVDHGSSGKRQIAAGCLGGSLGEHLLRPDRGMDFDDWARSLLGTSVAADPSEWTISKTGRKIMAKKVYRSSMSFILDLKIDLSV